MRRAHEALMVEKADIMNRLTQALDESQAQCHNLLSNNNGQEALKLQAELNLANRQKEDLEKIVEDLKVRVLPLYLLILKLWFEENNLKKYILHYLNNAVIFNKLINHSTNWKWQKAMLCNTIRCWVSQWKMKLIP